MGCVPRRGLAALFGLLCYVAVLQGAILALQQPPPSPPRAAAVARRQRQHPHWDRCFARLEEFQRAHGHTLVRREDDPVLYRWTRSQRINYRHQAEQRRPTTPGWRPRLSGAKLRRLEDLGFVWDVQEYRWNQRYRELEGFYNDTNHTQVPSDGPEGLYIWVQNQRREYKRWLKGENSTLTPARIIALDKLRFDRDTVTFDRWYRRYLELEDFHHKHGHADVPESYADNPALGMWVMNQRKNYRRYADGEPSALTEERAILLEKLDFSWRYREDKWHEMKLRLLDYYEAHGHLRIATNDTENSDLRLWLNLQRYYYGRSQEGKASPMTAERVKALECEIPNFAWRGRNKRAPWQKDWARLFDAMRAKGLRPGMPAKSHWFDGVNPLKSQVKSFWTEEDLVALWNEEEKEDDDSQPTKKPY